MKERFYELAGALPGMAQSGEVITCVYDGEDSGFCRINGAKVRQAGHVTQESLKLRLMRNARQATASFNLTGYVADDLARCTAAIAELRGILPLLPEDPFLIYATEVKSSDHSPAPDLPPSTDVVGELLADAAGSDMVGLYAAGGVYRAFANSLGQTNWFASHTLNLDASLYVEGDKAVKLGFAGFKWDRAAWREKLAEARRSAAILKRPAKVVEPGKYRVYLAPSAVDEVFDLLSWNAFGLKAQRTKQSALNWLVEQRECLSPLVSVSEDIAGGMSPAFDDAGFVRPAGTPLVTAGKAAQSLASARSGKEFSVPGNGANGRESPESLAMAPGSLSEADILEKLDTGIYVNNLWYLNYSDRQACRMTGMTRFATLWVEKGEVVAPLSVMRFDESLYRLLGSELEGLTATAAFMPSSSTYERRSTVSRRLPGAMVANFSFTL